MPKSRKSRNTSKNVEWGKFGLNEPPEVSTPQSSELIQEFEAASHITLEGNELFAEELKHKPWWKSNFFISEPVLFGQWDGVFTSCLINIFGVIVFLRSGWIVAQAGILIAVFIVLATVAVALISVLSAVGICERCRMESGGVYFLLAHVLGSRFGGSIGLIYCFGQAVGCALYVLGFGESLSGLFELGSSPWAVRGFASLAVILLGIINIAGVKWVVKLQFVLLLILLLAGLDFAVGSFVHTNAAAGFTGWLTENLANNVSPDYKGGYNSFTVFGVFFPTITGVMAGINMSGDLRAPSRDIPNGSLAAICTGTFLYLIFILFLGATCERSALLNDFMMAAKVSAFQFLLLAGLYVSSMSSCLAAMYGTPRVLQSIAKQNVLPVINFLGQGRGPNKVPLYAMAVVAGVTLTFILIGEINTLAPIVTMPFLLTYASIDYSYFALAQIFDIQLKNELRFRNKGPPTAIPDSHGYGAISSVSESSSRNTLSDSHYQVEALDKFENDLDHLFPERTQHKESNAKERKKSGNSEANTLQDAQVHSKPRSWYSPLCNRWLSLFGAITKIIIMIMVHWLYAIICLVIVAVIWFYIGAANPAVKPGLAQHFTLFYWIKSLCLRAAGKKGGEPEQMVVPPIHSQVPTSTNQLNEDNEDFSDRRRYHQSKALTTSLVDLDD
ncbi:UNVERIFIED_CONTAM: hypothetical protein PYX00_000620 [Menopon gallinae]|uniref:Solute carrier family 12 member 8 n=1 Tax=Menopon gallinae TaxID=328185 RepID=A0AAW2IBV3_9NEOP